MTCTYIEDHNKCESEINKDGLMLDGHMLCVFLQTYANWRQSTVHQNNNTLVVVHIATGPGPSSTPSISIHPGEIKYLEFA